MQRKHMNRENKKYRNKSLELSQTVKIFRKLINKPKKKLLERMFKKLIYPKIKIKSKSQN